ncbi:hypothetical protein T484DRAFT_1755924, partial [Baffinella frigidus]
MASHLAAIDVAFDRATDRASGLIGRFPCSLLLEDLTLISTGNSSICGWTSDKSFRVNLGIGATILPGDSLTIKMGVVKTRLRNSPYAFGAATLFLPPSFTQP